MSKKSDSSPLQIGSGFWLPVVLASICLLLYGYRLDVPSIWLDEAYSWMYATGTWSHWWEGVCYAEDCGGFLFTLLLKCWIPVFGTGEAELRWLPVLISLGSLLMLYAAHRRLLGVWPAYYGSLLLMLHPLMIQYSRLLRSYSLLIFSAAFLLWAISRYVQNSERPVRDQLWISCGCLLATVSHVFGIFLLGGVAISYLIDACLSSQWRKLVSGWLFLLPVIVWFGAWVKLMEQRVNRNLDHFWIQQQIVAEYQYMMEYLGYYSVIFLAVAFLIFLFYWLSGQTSYRDQAVIRYALWTIPIGCAILFCPLLASLFSRGTHHFVNYRYCLAILPLLATWLILSVQRLPIRLQWIPVLIFLFIPAHYYATTGQFTFYQDNYPFGLEMRRAADFLKTQPSAEPVLIIPHGHHAAFLYYRIPQPILMSEAEIQQKNPEPMPQFLVVTCTVRVEESGLLQDEVNYESLARFSQVEILRARRKSAAENLIENLPASH